MNTPIVIRVCAVWLAGTAAAAWAQAPAVVYRCPDNHYTSDREITPQKAKAQGCRTIDGAPITVVQMAKPRAVAASAASRPAETKVDAGEQRARDSDARKILETELQREQTSLDELLKEFNNGEPERRGDERNYQKYLDRVEEMKATIARKQSDVAALRRELAKLPAAKE